MAPRRTADADEKAPQVAHVDACIVLYQPDVSLLTATLAALSTQPHLRTIRVHHNCDSVSDQALAQMLPTGMAERTVISRSPNLGFAAAQNKLLHESFDSGSTHALVLNPDLVLERNALETLLAVAARKRDAALVSGTLLLGKRGEDEAPDRVDSAGTRWTRTSRHLDVGHGTVRAGVVAQAINPTAALTGALLLVPRKAWLRIQGVCGEFFDADFFAYREDAELGLRAWALGVGCFVSSTAVGVHYRGTPGVSRDNPVVNRLGVQNRFLIRFKWGAAGRPGNVVLSSLRDLGVVVSVLLIEKDSRPGLTAALRLRREMRQKRSNVARALSAPPPGGVDDESPWSWKLRALLVDAPSRSVSPALAVVMPVHRPTMSLMKKVTRLGEHAEVIVVHDDDASLPEELHGLGAHLLEIGKNTGIAAALNVGVSYALDLRAESILTLDQDSDLSPAGMRRLLADLDGLEREGRLLCAVAPGRVAAFEATRPEGSPLQEVTEALQSGLLMRAETFRREGMFDERLVIDGVDTEFCLRLRDHGGSVWVDHDVSLQHALGESQGVSSLTVGPWRPVVTRHAAFRRYYMNRNRLRLVAKYGWKEPRWAAVTVRRTMVSNLLAWTVEEDRLKKMLAAGEGMKDGVLGRSGPLRTRRWVGSFSPATRR